MVLVWNGQAWVADWSAAAYNRVYTAVPPSRYGLELLSWERPHLQLKGVNGADLQQPVGRWAAAHGLRANVIVGSTWPPVTPPPAPTPAAIPAVPLAPAVPATGRVLVPTRSGWRDARGERLVLPVTGETVTLNAQAASGDVYLGGVVWPD